jgi:hypothetical protein
MIGRRNKARRLVLGFCFTLFITACSFARGFEADGSSHFKIVPADDNYADSARYYLHRFESVLEDLLDFPLDTVVTLYIANTEDDFRMRAGSTIPDWGAAAALPRNSVMVIKSPKRIRTGKNFRELIGHELSHIMLYRATKGHWLPRWIHEGVAMHVSGEWNIGQDILVARAAWTGNLIHLHRLEGLTEFNGAQANLAYTQSYLAVSDLLRRGDRLMLADLIALYNKNRDFHRSFKIVTGEDYNSWINGWLERTSMQYHFLLFIFDSRILWLLIPLIFILLIIYKRRQSARIRKRWKVEDRLNPPDDSYDQYFDGYYDEENKV